MTEGSEIRDFTIPCIQAINNLRNTCNREGLIFVPPNTKKRKLSVVTSDVNDEIYEVEKIVNYAKDPMGHEWYLVKWKGWPDKNNSWEPISNLSGSNEAINDFQLKRISKMVKSKLSNGKTLADVNNFLQILVKQTALMKEFNPKNGTNGLTNTHKSSVKRDDELIKVVMDKWLRYQKLQEDLRIWETKLNSVCNDKVKINVENQVDFEGPPQEFTYINDYKPSEGIIIPNDPPIGCECDDCYKNRKKCCSHSFGIPFAYNKYKKMNVNLGTPIYECNSKCPCPPTCTNRVVQHGRKIELAIFRTSNGCGWGVKTLEYIRKDTFVMEYVGEVITNEEAEIRGQKYDAEGRTYLFDLDFDDADGDCPFTVDATYFGNVSHFMNHSCEPNLVVYGVWINNLDPRLPRLAFFSERDIKKGEELTFDYKMSKGDANLSKKDDKSHIQCKCGSNLCRKILC